MDPRILYLAAVLGIFFISFKCEQESTKTGSTPWTWLWILAGLGLMIYTGSK